MKGLHVFPGAIDSDFQGKIRVMARTLKTILTVTPEQKNSTIDINPLSFGLYQGSVPVRTVPWYQRFWIIKCLLDSTNWTK
jgi:hypothetical protein